MCMSSLRSQSHSSSLIRIRCWRISGICGLEVIVTASSSSALSSLSPHLQLFLSILYLSPRPPSRSFRSQGDDAAVRCSVFTVLVLLKYASSGLCTQQSAAQRSSVTHIKTCSSSWMSVHVTLLHMCACAASAAEHVHSFIREQGKSGGFEY